MLEKSEHGPALTEVELGMMSPGVPKIAHTEARRASLRCPLTSNPRRSPMSKTKAPGEGFTLALALCASLLTVLSLSPLQAATWFLQEVDPDTTCGENSAIVDANHYAHVFYYRGSPPNVYLVHSFWNGSGWTREVVAEAEDYTNGGPSAAFDSQGRIHVAYSCVDGAEAGLGYALFDGSWHFETLDTVGDASTADQVSLALDSHGNPHIAYFRGITGIPLRYVYKRDGNWVFKDGLPDNVAWDPSLVLDSLDHAHFIYMENGDYNVYYSIFDGANWTHDTVPSPGANSYSSLVLDRRGTPIISFFQGSNGPPGGQFSVWFARKDGGVWNNYLVDAGSQTAKRGWSNHVAVTPDDTVHIAYYCHNEMLLKHAWGDGSSWNSEVVESIVAYTSFLGFCADGQDLFISYTKGHWEVPYLASLWLASTRDLSGVEEEKGVEGSKAHACPATPNLFRSFASVPGHERERFALYDLSGKRVGTYPGNRIGSDVPPGVYFLRPEGHDSKPLQVVKVR
jgi:hypothetical protein